MDGEAGGGTTPRRERSVTGLLGWWQGLAERLRCGPGLPRIATQRAPPALEVRRSAVAAGVEARLAVRSGVRLDDFLRNRLARYAAELRVATTELPVELDVENGEPVLRTRPVRAAAAAAPRPSDDRFVRALVELEGPVAARELRDASAAIDALDARAAEQRRRADAIAARLADDLESGAIPAPPRVEATAEQLGRPAVPSLAAVVAPYGLAAAMLAAETWQLAGPVLALSGHDVRALSTEAVHDPAGVLLGLAFALSAAAAIFALAHAAVRRADDLAAAADASLRRRWLAATAWIAALGAIALSALSAGLAPAALARAALLAAIPFAGALLLRAGSAARAPRAAALEAALAWDRARVREEAERARRAAALALAQDELRATEAERARAARRLRDLEARAIAATRKVSEEADARARRLDRLADALAAALELDRYAFLRVASALAHDALVRPVRPERYEPAIASGPERLVAG